MKTTIFIILLAACALLLIAWTKHPTIFSQSSATFTHAPADRIDSQGRYIPDKPTKTSPCQSQGSLPDPACTPGAVNPLVTQSNTQSTICVKGYTKTIRPSSSYTNNLKRQQLRAYGFSEPLSDYEEDHQIPLELGGDPVSPANLWPEPHEASSSPGSFEKDHVENYLRVQVCNGVMLLADAQAAIATNWVSVFNGVGSSITSY